MTKTTVLPSAEEIIRRFTAWNADSWNVENIYPKIASLCADQECLSVGILLFLHTVIAEVSDGKPPMVAAALEFQIPSWLNVLIDDPEVLSDELVVCECVNKSISGESL